MIARASAGIADQQRNRRSNAYRKMSGVTLYWHISTNIHCDAPISKYIVDFLVARLHQYHLQPPPSCLPLNLPKSTHITTVRHGTDSWIGAPLYITNPLLQIFALLLFKRFFIESTIH
jgi:hypothetical protein